MLPSDFVVALALPKPEEVVAWLQPGSRPAGGRILELVNDVRPCDLFCYLHARFGKPNGFLSHLRKDDSDNLIHWEWTLRVASGGLVSFQGHNFRTEVHLPGGLSLDDSSAVQLVSQFKADFGKHGEGMTKVRKGLEPWVEFVNPYQRIRRAVDSLLAELESLGLDKIGEPSAMLVAGVSENEQEEAIRRWNEAAEKYSRGFGLCFGVRAMLPVLAESFVNLLLFVLMHPHIKVDERLRDNVVRQPIDVRIKSLSTNCHSFDKHPDYASNPCRRYHTLVNERNDLHHGNVVIDKLRFNDVYFLGRVPVFKEYRSAWQRSLGVEMRAVGLSAVRDELKTVDDLVEYLLSCLGPSVRKDLEIIMSRFELGINTATQRLGVLFPPWLVDMRMMPGEGPSGAPARAV